MTVESDPVRLAALLGETPRPASVDLALDGHALLANLGVDTAGVCLYQHGHVEFASASLRTAPGRALVPVTWVCRDGLPVFPRMEGTLEIEVVDRGQARFTLSANYDPPLVQLGLPLDRALLLKLAEATMGDFLGRLASRLRSTATFAR